MNTKGLSFLDRNWMRVLRIEQSILGQGSMCCEGKYCEGDEKDPLINIAAIHPTHRGVFVDLVRSYKGLALNIHAINNDKNWGKYCQPLEGLIAVIDTMEGFLDDPRCVWRCPYRPQFLT